jgi:hypothetical protein
MTRRKPASREARRGSASMGNGATTSASRTGVMNAAGRTPTMAWASPFRMSDPPTADGLPPKRRVQKPWVSTTTLAPLPCSSSGASIRPRAARAPSIAKNDADTFIPWTRSASPPVRFALH